MLKGFVEVGTVGGKAGAGDEVALPPFGFSAPNKFEVGNDGNAIGAVAFASPFVLSAPKAVFPNPLNVNPPVEAAAADDDDVVAVVVDVVSAPLAFAADPKLKMGASASFA